MMEIIVKTTPEVPLKEAEVGDVRMSKDGRIILVIRVEIYDNVNYFKTLILKEGKQGRGTVFHTIPKNYRKLSEITGEYPILLKAETIIQDGGETL